MKTIKNEFEKVSSFENLQKAHIEARRGKRNKKQVIEFEINLNYNLYKLKDELDRKTYQIGAYNKFLVKEPKEREIMALHYRDRVVQHSFCDNVIEPYFDKKLDYDNAACRKGKGTHFALDRLKSFARAGYNKWGTDFYVLKCDISKYFYNIRHDILKKDLYRHFSDKELIWLLDVIIDSTKGNTGIPIGNMTSQWFAIFYLDKMDKFIRKELDIKYYSRYMDDFVLIHKDKDYLKECLKKIKAFLKEEMDLELNSKTQIFPIKNGVDFLGFHTYLTKTGKVIRKIRRKSKQAMRRKVKCFNSAYEAGKLSMQAIRQSTASWRGHAKHGNTFYLRGNILSKLIFRRPSNEANPN